MAVTVAELVARLRADATGVVNGTTVARDEFKKTEAQAVHTAGVMDAASKQMGNFGLPFANAAAQAGKAMDQTAAKSVGFTGAMKTAGTAILAVAAVVVFESVKMASAAEVAGTRLTVALNHAGQASAAYRKEITATDERQLKLGFTYAQTETGIARLVSATGSVAKATRDQAIASDIARARGLGLQQATDLLVKVEAGRYTLLGRQLGVSKQVIAGFRDSADAVQYLGSRFGGSAAAYADTFAGRLEVVKARLEEAGVSIGKVAIPAIEDLAHWFEVGAEAFSSFNNFLGGVPVTLIAVGAAGAVVVALGAKLASAWSFVAEKIIAYQAAQAASTATTEANNEVIGQGIGINEAYTAAVIQQTAAIEARAAVGAAGAALPTGFGATPTGLLAPTGTLEGIGVSAGAASGAEVAATASTSAFAASLAGMAAVALPVAAAIAIFGLEVHQANEAERQVTDQTNAWAKAILALPSADTATRVKDTKDLQSALGDLTNAYNVEAAAIEKARTEMLKTGDPTRSMAVTGALDVTQLPVQITKIHALHDAFMKVIADQGVLAAKPFFDKFIAQASKIPGAMAALGHSFDDVKAAIATVEAAHSNLAGSLGISAAAQLRYDDALAKGKTLSDETTQAYYQAAAGLEAVGVSAVYAAQAVAEGMSSAAIAVQGFVAAATAQIGAQQAFINVQQSVQGITDAQTQQAKSAGGSTGATKTAAAAYFDAAAKAKAYQDAVNGLADAQEAAALAPIEAQRAYQDLQVAENGITRANQDHQRSLVELNRAQIAYNTTVNGYAASSRTAKDAQREVRDKLLSLQQAQVAANKAQTDFVALQKTGKASTTDLQNAELNVQQATNAASDAYIAYNDSVTNLQTTLDGYSRSSQQAQDAQWALVQAQRAAQDSSVAQRSALRGVQDAFVGVLDKNKAVVRSQQDLHDANIQVNRALADQEGKLNSASRAAGSLASHVGSVRSATLQAQSSLFEYAKKVADTIDPTERSTIWAQTFYNALVSLKGIVHPNAQLAVYLDALIQKFYLLLHPAAIGASSYQRGGSPGTTISHVTARGTVALGPQVRLIGEAGPEAVVPLGNTPENIADRKKIMALAGIIAPDISRLAAPAISPAVHAPAITPPAPGSPLAVSVTEGGGDIYIAEMHNHLLRNDRDLFARLSTLDRTVGAGIRTTRT